MFFLNLLLGLISLILFYHLLNLLFQLVFIMLVHLQLKFILLLQLFLFSRLFIWQTNQSEFGIANLAFKVSLFEIYEV